MNILHTSVCWFLMGNTQECQFELSKVLSRKMEEKSLLSFPKFCTIKKHMEYS